MSHLPTETTTDAAEIPAPFSAERHEELRGAVRNLDAALEFTQPGEPIPYDLATAGMDLIDTAQRYKDALAVAERHYAEYDTLYHEVAKPILDARREALAEVARLAGAGHTFQDECGIVYQLADKKGTFVEFTPFEMKRTQREYAEGGSHVLARKTAEELGFRPYKPEKEAREPAAPVLTEAKRAFLERRDGQIDCQGADLQGLQEESHSLGITDEEYAAWQAERSAKLAGREF